MHRMLLFYLLVLALFAAGCGGSNDTPDAADCCGLNDKPDYDFSLVGPEITAFLDEFEAVKGTSYILVHKDYGILHEEAFGDHTLDTIVPLASTSKVPSAGILMSLADDGFFDIDEPIADYLDWGDSKPGITVGHLLSNTSGLPGLGSDHYPCQSLPDVLLSECAMTIYQTDVGEDLSPPGTVFQYGGGQWQVAGGIAEAVSGQSWEELVRERLIEPCELDVFEYGSMGSSAWTGDPNSLIGQSNPRIEGGAISNLHDYAKILMMHLNDGMCGEERVLSKAAVAEMRIDRGSAVGGPAYGLGWWITLPGDGGEATLFNDPGVSGTFAWIDLDRGYGGYLALETNAGHGFTLHSRIRPLIEAAIDAAESNTDE